MPTIIGVRFRELGKITYLNCGIKEIFVNDFIVAKTLNGIEFGKVLVVKKDFENTIKSKNEFFLRKATKNDINKLKIIQNQNLETLNTAKNIVANHKLKIKLISAEYTFDKGKIIFYFVSEGRVDFRNLVKDMAQTFKTRIELRQTTARQASQKLGGFGICGRPFCCSTFLSDFNIITIKMAKSQGCSLNSNKNSGSCERLLCCLKYENDMYLDLAKNFPQINTKVSTPKGKGTVIDNNIINQQVKIILDNVTNHAPTYFNLNEIKIL